MMTRQGLAEFCEAMASGWYDLIILDEIIVAIDYGLLKMEEVKNALAQKPPAEATVS